MDTSAIIMFLVGAIGLWGGLILAIINYNRMARREKSD
ncbi:MAG TPA: methionine/alanine import family NSS transporter small subunit [Nocardioidaceae bacterium]|nr:methionine/alanine import family NSS transporter small subunit [Nocardioidaceae bacterium]